MSAGRILVVDSSNLIGEKIREVLENLEGGLKVQVTDLARAVEVARSERSSTIILNLFPGIDEATGYKLFRREVIQSLEIEEKAFGVEPEITAKVAFQNWRVYEVGISYSGRTYAEGKKIGWRDGTRAVYCIWRYGLWRKITGRAKRRSEPLESGE